MKVGYFVETPVEHNLTGGSRSFLDLLEQLVPMGVEPFVVISERWKLTDILTERGIPFITTKMYRPFVGIKTKARFYHIKYYIKLIFNTIAKFRAYRFFKENDVELVHINSQFCGIIGCEVAEELNIPYIYHIREFLDQDFGVTWYNQKQSTEKIGKANVIIAISDAIKEYQKSKYIDKVNIIRIYNGLDIRKIKKREGEKKLQQNLIKLVITGRVCKAKNQFDAVRAIEILVSQYNLNVKLYIIGYMGTDPYELDLNKYIIEHKLTNFIELKHFTNNPFEIIDKCDIGLTCSIAEAFGRVTIEYMMSGLLAIGSDSGGTPELIHNNIDGFLYELNNSEDLAEKILWCINHPIEAQKIIENGVRNAVDNFSIKKTAKNVYKIYQNFNKK